MKLYLTKFSIIVMLTVSFATACTAEDQATANVEEEETKIEGIHEVTCNQEKADKGDMYEIVNCLRVDIGKKDVELNKLYKEINSYLTDDERKQLKKSQLNWIQFKENEEKFIYTIFQGLHGEITGLSVYLNITERRIKDLEDYLVTLKLNSMRKRDE